MNHDAKEQFTAWHWLGAFVVGAVSCAVIISGEEFSYEDVAYYVALGLLFLLVVGSVVLVVVVCWMGILAGLIWGAVLSFFMLALSRTSPAEEPVLVGGLMFIGVVVGIFWQAMDDLL